MKAEQKYIISEKERLKNIQQLWLELACWRIIAIVPVIHVVPVITVSS